MNRQQLAKALDIDVRTLRRLVRLGMPEPADGETLNSWSARATQWREDTRKTPGPKKSPERQKREDLEAAILEEKLEKLRRENKVQAGELHSRKQCQLDEERNYQQVAQALLSVGAKVARKCYQKSPEEIQVTVDDEIRRCLEIVSRGKRAPPGPSPSADAS